MTDPSFLGTNLGIWARIGLLLSVSMIIWCSWFAWIRSRNHGILYAIICAQLFSIAQICLTELALGLVHLLYAGMVIVINIGIAMVLFWRGGWFRGKRANENRESWWKIIRNSQKSPVAVVVIFAFLGITAWNLFLGWFLPPLQWDGLAYHLPMMAAFYQSHAVFPIQASSVWIRFYPINGELLGLWSLLLVGIDKLVDWAFVPSVVGGVVALYGLCRRAGASPTCALLGASLIAFAPGMLIQQTGALNDAFFASLVVMGVFIVLGEAPTEGEDGSRSKWLSCLGMATAGGLLTGLKYSGIVYALGLLVLFAVTWINPRVLREHAAENGRRFLRTISLPLCAFVLFAGLGAYPYIRNIVTARNPVAPFQISVGGTVLLEGEKQLGDYLDSSETSTANSMNVFAKVVCAWFEPYQSVYEVDLSGFGPLWLVIGIPALLAWLVESLHHRRTGNLVLTGCLFACSLLTPDFWHPRYIYSLLILGGMAVASILEMLNPWIRRLVIAEMLFLICFSVYNVLVPNRVSPGDLQNVLLTQNDQSRSSQQFIQPEEGRAAYAWIDNATMNNPSVIAFGRLIRFPYALHGTDLRNQVVYFLPDSEADWGPVLDQTGTNYVLVLDWTTNYLWTQNLPDFQEVFRDGQYVIFQRSA
jgi:hypothetical protein